MFNTAVNFLRLRRGSTPDKPPAKRRTTSKQSTSSILHKVRRGRVDRGRFEVDKQTAKAITRMARQTALGFSPTRVDAKTVIQLMSQQINNIHKFLHTWKKEDPTAPSNVVIEELKSFFDKPKDPFTVPFTAGLSSEALAAVCRLAAMPNVMGHGVRAYVGGYALCDEYFAKCKGEWVAPFKATLARNRQGFQAQQTQMAQQARQARLLQEPQQPQQHPQSLASAITPQPHPHPQSQPPQAIATSAITTTQASTAVPTAPAQIGPVLRSRRGPARGRGR